MRVWLVRERPAVFCVLKRIAAMGFFLAVMCIWGFDVQVNADENWQDAQRAGRMYSRIIACLMDTLRPILNEVGAAGLTDGNYTPDRFGYSGGTGRVTISCQKVTVREGRAYATLVFDSGSYSYVKVGGTVYEGSNTADTSVFEIPVLLNRNNTVVGCTTKMSSAHEIAYSIFIYIEEIHNGSGALPDAGGALQAELSREAPKLAGLTFERETQVENAELFKIFHYKGGITCIEADHGIDADEKTDAETKESETEPYGKRIVRYLIVPDKAEVPAGLDKEMVIIRRPGGKGKEEGFCAYAASASVLKWMNDLKQLENLSLLGIPEEECQIPDVTKLLKEGKITFGGTYDDVEYKALVTERCNLALMPSEIISSKKDAEGEGGLPGGWYETYTETAGNLSELGIPMFVDRSSEEGSYEGQAEWVKVYGALFDCEEEARDWYQEELKIGRQN